MCVRACARARARVCVCVCVCVFSLFLTSILPPTTEIHNIAHSKNPGSFVTLVFESLVTLSRAVKGGRIGVGRSQKAQCLTGMKTTRDTTTGRLILNVILYV